MTQNQPRTTPQPPYLFEHVFRNLTSRFWLNIFKPEIVNIKKVYASKTVYKSAELFEVFPRSNIFYKQMICDLTDIAKYDVVQCVNYLFVAIGDIAMNRKSKAFDSINNAMPNDQFAADIILKIKKLLLTDLICAIVSKMETMEQQSAKNLITCGIYFCMSQSQKDDFPNFLLKQWSVIFSYISIFRQVDLFDRLTQLIINKYDLFFTLMRFVRLDKDNEHADDILEIMASHLKRAKRKNIITSSMFNSISTILSTYTGNSDLLGKILAIALEYINKKPIIPGAADLVVTLLPHTNAVNPEDFFEQYVYPLAQTEEGILSAARAFRTMMFNHNLRPDFLFYVWNPTRRENSFAFLSWEVNYDPKLLTDKFNQHFFPSPYINTCSTIIMQIIVRIAAMDFKNFIENIFPKFVNSDIDSPQFKVFLSIVPMINDEQFMNLSNGISKDDIEHFNTEFANTTNNKMKIIINSLQGYTLHISDDFKNKAAKANKTNSQNQTVLDAFNKLNIDIGVETNFQGEENKVQKDRNINSSKVIRIIPYLVNSKIFLTKEWMKSFVRLSALADDEVSKPAHSICQSIFQQEEKRMEFCDVLIEMSLQIEQKMEVLYMCISMLFEIVDFLEPNTPKDDNAEEYSIEFVALLGLASSYPVLRSIAYELLIKTNKLLQNQGLFSQIEDHIPAIASNVNHNIMLQTFPKRPGKNEYTEDIFSFTNLLYSNYQEPWLFFLAEFGRVISYSKYDPMLKRIKEHCQKYGNHIKEIDDKNQEHLDLGLLSLFISTCTIKDYSENNLFVYEIPVKTDHNTESFSNELATIIHSCFKYEKYNLIFKALKHVNYTVVPLIFNVLKDILKESSMTNSLQMKNFNINQNQTKSLNMASLFFNILPSFHLMFSAIEGTKISCKQVQPIAIEIYFIICSDQYTMTMLQKMIEMNSNNEENFRKSEQITLCFLTFLNFCMECYIQVTSNTNNKNNNLFAEKKSISAKLVWEYLCFLLTRNDKKNPQLITIKTYAAWVLQTIINKANKIIPMCKEPEIKTISNCERYGYSVLYPLLKLNTFGYFNFFANSCFRRKGLMADAFFSAIYQRIYEIERNKEFKDFYNSHAGILLLLGILRFKTGSPYAKDFLEQFYDIYPQASQLSSKNIPIDDIIKDPASHFERITEQVVKAALEQMKDKKFKGTIKVMVDILKKWIIKFRLLPNQRACIPSKVSFLVYPMYQFLNDLMEITINFRYNHDFQRIVDLWAILLKVKDNQYTVPVFITEYATDKETYTELKCELFKLLLEDKTMTIIPKTLAKRCKFAYYAYVTYQKKKDMDNEFWIVDVLITALKKCDNYIENFLPELLHFAILFHSNQTQSLLKRLCKRYNVLYTRRTLSTISVQHLVADFNKIISKIDEKRMKEFEQAQLQEEEKKRHEEAKKMNELKKNQTPNINTYANLNSILNPTDDSISYISNSESSFNTFQPQPTTKISAKPPSLDKKGLFFTDDVLSKEKVYHPIQRSITPTTISQPFSIPKKQNNSSAFVSDDSSLSDNSSVNLSNSSMSSTDDEFEISTPKIPTATIHPKVIKRSTGIIPTTMHSKSTPPAAKKKKRSLNMKWAKEAMRWTIGTQNLRLAYMSIIILNSLQNYEINQRVITELLLGVCKSTAYFLSINEHTEDKSLLYDFIDEAFKLFKRHFVGNERLAFNFIKSFLPFVVSVDAYFENMLPLFESCLSSEITEVEAQPYLLDALRPYFNELESDSTAREAFSNFEKKATTNAVDIKFVKIVLRRVLNIKAIQASQQQQLQMSPQQQQLLEKKKEKNEEDENLLIRQATNEQLNRAFLHYSLMVGNASADLKRRIFTISSKIIEEIQNQRKRDSGNERRPSMQESTENETDENLPLSPAATTTTTTTAVQNQAINDDIKNNNYNDKLKENSKKSSKESQDNKSYETETATLTPVTTSASVLKNVVSPSTVSTTTTNDTGTTTTTVATITNVAAPLNTAPVEPQQTNGTTDTTKNNCTEDEADKNDLNAQALLVIFKEAADCLPWMKEAIEFIRNLSIFYPLIPTVPLINDFGWAHEARVVIDSISKFAPRETINVSLVNCSNLNSLSILLTVKINDKKSHSIKVLPFSSILDTFPSNSKELKHYGFDDLTRKLLKVSTDFKNKVFKSISPKADFFITGHWNVVNFDPSASFIGETDLWLKFKSEKKMSPLLSKEDFLSLEDE